MSRVELKPAGAPASAGKQPAQGPALAAVLQQAIGLQQAGRLDQARELFERVLRAHPRHAEALHRLGLLAAQQGNAARAAELIGEAIAIDPDNAVPYCNRGLALQQMGLPQAALECYDRAISLQPAYAQAHANRGNALRELGEPEAALASYERAIACRDDFAPAHVSRGVVLGELNRLDEALRSLERAVALQPAHAAAHCNLGNVQARLGQPAAALASYERALALQADFAEAHCNRATLKARLGDLEAARAGYERAIALRPDYLEACIGHARALMALGSWESALAACDRIVALRPDSADAHFNRGSMLYQLKRLDAALASYERAIALRPDHAEAYSNRGIVQRELYQLDAALESYDRALAIEPEFAEAHMNRGNVLAELRRPAQALESFERALAGRRRADTTLIGADALPDHVAVTQYNRALALLVSGDYENGWREYERRFEVDRGSKVQRPHGYGGSRWRGEEPLSGKRILLHHEQGLGDTLQFCRYATEVARLGAEVILEVQHPLVRLLRSIRGVTQVFAAGEALPGYDLHCSLMSAPLALKTTLASVPAQIPYLDPGADRIRGWAERLGTASRPRVGLVWSGGFRPDQPELWAVNRRRNIPLELFAPLRNPDVEFYSLQKGQPAEAELASLAARGWDGPDLKDLTGELRDFADTAALVANLDLVIAVDTSTAHLAGALGKPVWILNRFDNCWRWLLDRADSPWYPSARLYRQERYGEWEAVIARVAADLREFARARA